jgi:hypothetical protein
MTTEEFDIWQAGPMNNGREVLDLRLAILS